MRNYDYLIVGSGLYGATFAYLAQQAGKKCLVIDKRKHAGGNLYCGNIEGINVHEYGAHIFHTDSKDVWDFVNNIVKFNNYVNSPVANFKGSLYNLPFNMNTFYALWGVITPAQARAKIDAQRLKALETLKKNGIGAPRNLEEQALCLAGEDVYRKLIKGYTEKQWGRKCAELPAFIIRRLPFRFVFDNNYFSDRYQGIPIGGYNILIKQLLRGAETLTETDFFEDRKRFESLADKIVFTGRIDEFYGYRYGKLDYRTLSFETKLIDVANYQGNAVVNYTDSETPYTRSIEHKHFEPQADSYRQEKTVVSWEYPGELESGAEPFYPVNDQKNCALYAKYKILAEREEKTIFGGRLADYKYYDMDDVIEKAFADYAAESDRAAQSNPASLIGVDDTANTGEGCKRLALKRDCAFAP